MAMDNMLVWMAATFVAGVVFGMTIISSLFGGRGSAQPTVVVMEQRRPEMLEGSGGCFNIIFFLMLLVGVVTALVVLGS
jgi:hypothetical protein